METKLKDCFPTKMSLVIFLSYMGLFVIQGVLVTATKDKDSKYSYSTVTVVMFIECLKLFVSSSIYLREFPVRKLFQEIIGNSRVLLLYFVPASLYSLYNNLTFINLSVFDPTTYYLLLQFRVVVTGVVFQVLFKKKLSRKQWLSLILLTMGCIVKQLHMSAPSTNASDSGEGHTSVSVHINFYLFLVFVQVLCSCFAGVYNEYLLKDAGADVHLMIQNVFMYIDCIVCNFFVLLLKGEVYTMFTSESLSSVFQPLVIAVMVNGAACGIITSIFLKNLNSILKTFAAGLELVFTALLCWLIFGIPIDMFTVLAILIVSYATYLYSQNPVVNKGKLDKTHEKSSEEMVEIVAKEDSM